jgi:diguanylate cyclase (GGDEF)-like protein
MRQRGLLLPQVASEYRLCRQGGEELLAEVHASVLRDDVGEPSGLTIVTRDVTERKRLEQELTYQAFHDTLTGLANRALFQDRFEQTMEAARRNGEPFALLLLDLNRFKEVNDLFGHHCGDLLLREVGRRLQQGLRASDTVARLGGDEFAVLLPATDERGANIAAAAIVAEFERPFSLEEHTVEVGTSVGIVVYPEHGDELDTLLRHADTSMYAAKRTNTRRTRYR